MIKGIYISILFSFITIASHSQDLHFIFIQAQNNQPFYLKTKDNIFSSTDKGYLTVSKLTQGKFEFTIGFPKNKWSSLDYSIDVKQKDLGFILKKMDSTNWEMFNIQNNEIVIRKKSDSKSKKNIEISNDEFSNVLAQVSNTPSVKEIAINVDSSQFELENRAIMDTGLSTKEYALEKINVIQEVQIKDTSSNQKANLVTAARFDNKIMNTFSILDSAGRSAGYVVSEGGNRDTVVLFIAYDNKKTRKKEEETAEQIKIEAVATIKLCNAIATEKDFIQLRRMMVEEDKEDRMIEKTKDFIKEKCLTSEQVKNLAVLFLKEDNRYEFLNTTYLKTSDKENYGSLIHLLTEEEHITQFKNLISNK